MMLTLIFVSQYHCCFEFNICIFILSFFCYEMNVILFQFKINLNLNVKETKTESFTWMKLLSVHH